MKIRLMALTIRDFRGLRELTFAPQGADAEVRGANGTGKTTLMNAFLWLLSGKDSQGRDNYNIFPVDEDGRRIAGCQPSVEAELDADGRRVVLLRKLAEKRTKKAGSAEAVYTGDETRCAVDGVPCSVTEYTRFLGEMLPAGAVPLLVNAAWFCEQTRDHRERRRLLLAAFGGVTQEDILQDPELDDLTRALDGRTVEDLRKVLTEARKGYRAQLDAIPARIDENRSQLADGPDPEEASARIDRARAALADAGRRSSAGSAAQWRAEHEARVRVLHSMADDALRRLNGAMDAEKHRLLEQQRAELERASDAHYAAETARRAVAAEAEDLAARCARLEAEVDRQRACWLAVNDEEPAVEEVCPTCGQTIPPERVAQALAIFNEDKSRRLSDITRRAMAVKEELAAVREQWDSAARALEAAGATADAARNRHKAAIDAPPPVPDAGAFEELRQAVQAAGEELAAELAKEPPEEDSAAAEVAEAERELAAAGGCYREACRQQDLRRRIADLQNEQKCLLGEYEQVEYLLSLCDAYTVKLVQRMTGQVNERFRTVRWALFEIQKNGGVKEVCEASVDGVPYGALNTAGRMAANLEIIQAFGEAYGVRLPLFLDNRESVTLIEAPQDTQIIDLTVDPTQKTLYVQNGG